MSTNSKYVLYHAGPRHALYVDGALVIDGYADTVLFYLADVFDVERHESDDFYLHRSYGTVHDSLKDLKSAAKERMLKEQHYLKSSLDKISQELEELG